MVMPTKPLPSREELLKVLQYEPETGRLFWRECAERSLAWNNQYAGREAFSYVNSRGYRCGRIRGQDYKAHRIIWRLVHGDEPEFIDHIDGDQLNNRIENLRSVSHTQNMRNQKRHREGRIAISRVPKPETPNTPTGKRLRAQALSPHRPEALKLRQAGLSYAKIAAHFGVRDSTAYKWCQAIRPTF